MAKQFIELLARKRFADAAKWVDSDHPVCFFDDFEVCLTRTELEGCRSASERKVWQPDDPARTCEEGMGALIPPGWEQQATSNVNCPRHDITHSAMTLDPPPILVAIWRLDDRLREVRWVGLEERDGKVTVVAVWAARTWL